MATKTFQYPGWSLDDAVEALKAFDGGAIDSGVRDPGLKATVREHLTALNERDPGAEAPNAFDNWLTGYIESRFLSPAATALGYGRDDAEALVDWLRNNLGLRVSWCEECCLPFWECERRNRPLAILRAKGAD